MLISEKLLALNYSICKMDISDCYEEFIYNLLVEMREELENSLTPEERELYSDHDFESDSIY